MIGRRLPLRVRPLFFALAWPLIGFGIALGLNVDWDLSLFTGNVLLQIAAGDPVLPRSPSAFGFLLSAMVGLAMLAWSFTSARGQALFYPLAALLGLFVTLFGTTYLFDVNVSAEETAAGGVLFVFFDYANLFDRPFQTGFGLLIVILGLAVLGGASFGRRGVPRARPDAEGEFLPVAPSSPQPAWITPPHVAPRRAPQASATGKTSAAACRRRPAARSPPIK